MSQLRYKIRIKTSIRILSGMHIGAGDSGIEIGGIDSPVIKIGTKDLQPYIPGSSLKGKMRCLLEQIYGISEIGGGNKKREEKSQVCNSINNLFGFAKDNMPSKIIVRDSYLSEESIQMLNNCDLDMPFTENKSENSIDRVRGTANHPRQIERVPAGAEFNVEFIINIWDNDKEDELLSLLEEGIKAIENDYLGGSGSRGYGQVEFDGEHKNNGFKFKKESIVKIDFNNI